MSAAARYKLYRGDQPIFEGTTAEVAEFLGVSCSAISSHRHSYPGKPYKGYELVLVDDDICDRYRDMLRDAAAQWDAFCEPIRRKYGIPVHKEGAKDG